MTERPDLAALVAAIPDDQLPAVLVLLAARLAQRPAPVPHGPPPEDRLVTIDEAAERLGVTKDWLRRRPELAFTVRLSEGVVRYSAQGLAAFIRQHRPGR
ncbi:MAG: hypothetical protein U0807_03505 [Candidatus Binatia bacterium]